METIRAKISRVIYCKEDTGYKVLKVETPGKSSPIVTGEFGPEIVPGVIADFHGDYKNHPKYGHQFRAQSYTVTYDVAELSSIKMFMDAIAPNIGPERAEMIISHFGKDTIDVLDKEPHRLSEVKGIGPKSAESLSKSWTENREKWREVRQEYSLRAFLNSLGIREKKVKRILSHFGGGLSAEEKIRENPYALCEVDGFGFTTADHIARQLGVPENTWSRLLSFILYSLDVLCPASGHLFLRIDDLLKLVDRYSKENATKFVDGTVDSMMIKEAVIELHSTDRLVLSDMEDGTGMVYSKPSHEYEAKSARRLSSIMTRPSDLIFIHKSDIEKHIENFEKENSILLSREQKDALYYFVDKKVFILTGLPGTGKTTVLKAVVDLIKKLRLSLTCMTPTGISAKKMSTTINHEAYTIHRRLGFRGSEWMYNESNRFETDIVIVDESSMIDQEVLYRLLSALKDRVHILFVGDDNQLPSVGAGNVLRELVNCGQIPVVRLEQIFRQDEASDIIKVAHRIKNGDTDLSLFKSDPKADVFFLRENSTSRIEEIIIAMAQKFKNERRTFQVITARNDGPCSVTSLNIALQSVLNPPAPDLAEIKCYDYVLRRGDRVIVRENDYENGIFNGDIGKVVSIGGGFVSVEIDGRAVQLSVDELNDKIRLAYAISIHKSQGQEYPYIILPFITQFGRLLLQRNLLYTAITRAKKKVIVLGHGSAIERAINNMSVANRNTKLGERVRQCLLSKKSDSLPTPPEEPAGSPDAPSSMGRFLSEVDKFLPTGTTNV